MKRILFLISGIILNIFSIVITVYYLSLEIDSLTTVPILSKVFLISMVLITFYLGTILLEKSKYIKFNVRKSNLYLQISLYLFILIFMMLFDTSFGRGHGEITFDYASYIIHSVNIIPFHTITGYLTTYNVPTKSIIINLIGNLLAFAPLALFIPLANKNNDNLKSVTIKTAMLIITLEFTQFITMCGIIDIDDLILNLLGVILAYILIRKTKLDKFMKKYIYNL